MINMRPTAQLIPSKPTLRYLARLCVQAGESTTPACFASQACRVPRTISRPSWNRQIVRAFSSSSGHCFSASTMSRRDQDQPAAPLPDITNFYTLFPTTIPRGPPSGTSPGTPFAISLPALRKEFLRLQSLHHPDKFDPSTPTHQKALALSAFINNAYKTLSDPLLRAQYLLQLNYDIDVTNEDNSAHPTDHETLMEVMEAQERIEEAVEQEEIDTLKSENAKRIEETTSLMGAAFESGDADAAKGECVRLKYWRSLQQGLHDWEPGKEVRLIH